MSDNKDNDLLEGLNVIDDDELAEEVAGDEVDAMADIVDLLDDDVLVPEDSLEVATSAETVESSPVEVKEAPVVTLEPVPAVPKKKRNKPRKKVEVTVAEAPASKDNDTNDLYGSVAASVGAVVLDAGVLRIRASKVVIEAENIVFSS